MIRLISMCRSRATLTSCAALLMTAQAATGGSCFGDVDGSGSVGATDLVSILGAFGPCASCPEDLNGDNWVDEADIAVFVELPFGCPSNPFGARNAFDELVVVDVTSQEAKLLNLVVTHVYATGEDVGAGDALLVAGEGSRSGDACAAANADILADGSTLFFQEPIVGDDTAPESADIVAEPAVEYDTFVTMALLQDDSETELGSGGCLTETSINGPWYDFSPSTQREAIDISGATGNAGQFGVLIAQISMIRDSDSPIGYSGSLRLFTSPDDDGAPEGAEAPVSFCWHPSNEADLDVDGVVGSTDLAILLGSWGPCDGCPADIICDGDVNSGDLATLLGVWGPVVCP